MRDMSPRLLFAIDNAIDPTLVTCRQPHLLASCYNGRPQACQAVDRSG